MKFERASGILLHPTSLPGPYGIGDLGTEAFEFVDFLADSGQKYWQILPLGPTGYGDSPYQSFSAFAGNTLLISPEKLFEDGLCSQADLDAAPKFGRERTDYGGVYEWKSQLLPRVYEAYKSSETPDLAAEFAAFRRENAFWLDDYAIYRALKAAQDHKAWFEWPKQLRLRDPQTLASVAAEHAETVETEKFLQFVFYRQWMAIKRYANEKGVRVIGDIPIFVAADSADVWCNQSKFKLNEDGTARVVSGVPPDYFSKTGQLWGNPIYDWNEMRRDNFGWWCARVAWTLKIVDVARIDHFIGFGAAWEVPGKDKTAERGEWVKVPGVDVFKALYGSLGDLPLIAEDLGEVTDDVRNLRDGFGIPGMRILQFAFGGDAGNDGLPHNYVKNCVAYTGTHDNDTVVGWFDSQLNKKDGTVSRAREHCLEYLNSDGAEIHWDFIRAIWSSVADIAIVPAADLLGLGNDARMNLPATKSGNWSWRLAPDALTPEVSQKLRKLTDLYGRTANADTSAEARA